MEDNTAIQLLQMDGEVLVDSRIVAKGIHVAHESFMKTIYTYQSELEEFGILRFEIGVLSGPGQPPKYVLLNRNQIGVATSLSRNTKEVVSFKVGLFKAIDQLEQKIIPALQEEILQLRERAQLLLPERVTDTQAVEVLGQLKEMVQKEELGSEMDDVKRDNLEFALKKAQGYFNGFKVHYVNLKDKPNKWGEVRMKEYPDETEEDREYRMNRDQSIRDQATARKTKAIEEAILDHLSYYGEALFEDINEYVDASSEVAAAVLENLVRVKLVTKKKRGKVFWYSVPKQGE